MRTTLQCTCGTKHGELGDQTSKLEYRTLSLMDLQFPNANTLSLIKAGWLEEVPPCLNR